MEPVAHAGSSSAAGGGPEPGAEGELEARAAQQAVVAELGRRALAGLGLGALLQESVALAARSLDAEYGAIFEMDGQGAVLRAGVGWEPGLIGSVRIEAGDGTLAGSALGGGSPLIVHASDSREGPEVPPVLNEHRVTTGATVAVPGRTKPFGLLGVFTTASRVFSEDDVRFLQAVAGLLGTAIDRRRAELDHARLFREARAAEERYRSLVNALDAIVWEADARTLRYTFVSDRAQAILGYPSSTWCEEPDFLARIVHPDDLEAARSTRLEVAAEGGDRVVEYRAMAADGRIVWLRDQVFATRTDAGAVTLRGLILDVTTERTAERRRRAEHAVTAILSEAASLDDAADRILDTFRDLLDWHVGALWSVDNRLHVLRLRSERGVAQGRAAGMAASRTVAPGDGLAGRVWLSGKPLWIPDMSAEPGIQSTFWDMRAAVGFPITVRNVVLGVVELASTSVRVADEDLLAIMERTGSQIGQFIERAEASETLGRLAHTLQQSLLPAGMPRIPGIEVAGRYRPATAGGTDVGGDFYDVFEVAQNEWGIVLGDVCGKGPEAAALTALARYTVRAAVLRERRPSKVLTEVNSSLVRNVSDQRFCTAVYASVRTTRSGARLQISCAGHPAPLILRREGVVESAGAPGTLLGLFDDPQLTDVAIDLAPGDVVLFFTDGVTEARGRTVPLGEGMLRGLLRECAGFDAAAATERIERAVVDYQSGALRDDIALVCLRVPGA